MDISQQQMYSRIIIKEVAKRPTASRSVSLHTCILNSWCCDGQLIKIPSLVVVLYQHFCTNYDSKGLPISTRTVIQCAKQRIRVNEYMLLWVTLKGFEVL